MAPSPKQTRNIALVGGTGTLGAPVLAALLAAGHNVTVLTRASSGAVFPASVTTHRGAYEDEAFAASALAGQDALILALGRGAYAAQAPLIRAAARAGVAYVVPCEFGSDVAHARMRAELELVGEALRGEVDLVRAKEPYRALVEELGVGAWIGVTTGPWVEFSMRLGGLGIDLREKTARILDAGDVRANFTTLKRVGESLAAMLALPEEELRGWRNGWVYFSSFLASQRDLLASAVRATGTREEDWTVIREDSDEVMKACKEGLAKGDIMSGLRLLTSLAFKEGYGGDYSAKVIDYRRLGLKPENLDDVMKGLVGELQ
ncbi:NAD(P)-binding protein [Biscogniauxia marginata]|nr:NAD(P)-binding protein [Biscogniauxia marginata]